MTNVQRFNPDGSENLNYWFGEKKRVSVAFAEQQNDKPQYVRYSLEGLKKRSTKRLSKMHSNIMGYLSDRYTMISNLFYKLNELWNDYTEKLLDLFSNMTTGKRGRPRKFEDKQIFSMIADYELGGLKLTEIASKYNTNIATVSQTINGKGTYSYVFDDNYYNDRIYDHISFEL